MKIQPNNFDNLSRYDKAVQSHSAAPRALCFGDSWFQYIPHATDLNKQLARLFKGTLFLNEGVAGRDSGSWKRGLNRIYEEIGVYQFDAILLSAGGNDVVGKELKEFVKEASRPQSVGGADWGAIPPLVQKHIRLAAFKQALNFAISDLEEVIQFRDQNSRKSVICVHTYGYIWPNGKPFKLGPIKEGPWVKPFLDDVGVTDIEDQRIITSWLIDQFAERLFWLASNHVNLRVIDSRNILTKQEQWENEIHPTAEGFAQIAKKCWVPALTGILA